MEDSVAAYYARVYILNPWFRLLIRERISVCIDTIPLTAYSERLYFRSRPTDIIPGAGGLS